MNIREVVKALRSAGATLAYACVDHGNGEASGDTFECWVHVFKTGTDGRRFTAPTLSACFEAAMDWLGANPDHVAAAAAEATQHQAGTTIPGALMPLG